MNKKELCCNVDADLYDRFLNVLNIRGRSEDEVINELINEYIQKDLKKLLNEHQLRKGEKNTTKNIGKEDPNYHKALRKIECWKRKPNQNNHKILRAFWLLEEQMGVVSYKALEKRCSNKEEYPDTFVQKFKCNFDQLKTDCGNSNGKVFEIDDNGNVILWSEIKKELRMYRKCFIKKA